MPILPGDSVIIKIFKGINLIPADLNGKSDPYVLITSDIDYFTPHRTKTVLKTLNPEWNETFQLINNSNRTIEKTIIHFQVFDWDKFTKDDDLGNFHYNLNEFKPNEEEIYTVTLNNVKSGQLQFSITVKRSQEQPTKRNQVEEKIDNSFTEVSIFNNSDSNNAIFFIPPNFLTNYSLKTKQEPFFSSKHCQFLYENEDSISIELSDLTNASDYTVMDAKEALMNSILKVQESITLQSEGEFKVFMKDQEENCERYANGKFEWVKKFAWQFIIRNVATKCLGICVKPKEMKRLVLIIYSRRNGESVNEELIEGMMKRIVFVE
ncbi:hypothetical protein ABK040_009579 [Willaertia magna]